VTPQSPQRTSWGAFTVAVRAIPSRAGRAPDPFQDSHHSPQGPPRRAVRASWRRHRRLARIYDLRSTFASNALSLGVTVYELARIMGTSVGMIEAHYGALLDTAYESMLERLETAQGRTPL
jgi:hypothetical protein